MPQMAPISWLSLFFMFLLTFIMFNILNFFSLETFNTKKYDYLNNYKKTPQLNWKW